MASRKTEATELSVAFGLLGYTNPLETSYEEMGQKFQGTLSQEKYDDYIDEYSRETLYSRMMNVGTRIRENYPQFSNLSEIRWEGSERQAVTVSTAKDLQAVNIPISVKAKSNVVANSSPYNLFVATPSGSAEAKGESSWYLDFAQSEYQTFYSYVRRITGKDRGNEMLPESVEDFEAGREKKKLKTALSQLTLNPQQNVIFQETYLSMCHTAATAAANCFNERIRQSLASRTRATVIARVAKLFFRMDAVEYLLAGIEDEAFAVKIPDLTSWLREWEFVNIIANPDLSRCQSVVNFLIPCKRKSDGLIYNAHFHSEIRWSHGRFSSVEGKLYKEFYYNDLPFFNSLF